MTLKNSVTRCCKGKNSFACSRSNVENLGCKKIDGMHLFFLHSDYLKQAVCLSRQKEGVLIP